MNTHQSLKSYSNKALPSLKAAALLLALVLSSSSMTLAAQPEEKAPHLTWSQAGIPERKPSSSEQGLAGSSKTGNFIAVASDGPGTDCSVYLLDHAQLNLGWQKKSTLPHLVVYEVTYGKGQFIVFGGSPTEDKIIMTSPDGIAWSQNGISWNTKKFITAATNLANKTAHSIFQNTPFVSIGSDNSNYFRDNDSIDRHHRSEKAARKDKRFVNGVQKLSLGDDLFVAVGSCDYNVYHKSLNDDAGFAPVGSDAYPSIEADYSTITGDDDYFVAIGVDYSTGNTLSVLASKNDRNVFTADALPIGSDNYIYATAATQDEFLAIASDGSLFRAPAPAKHTPAQLPVDSNK